MTTDSNKLPLTAVQIAWKARFVENLMVEYKVEPSDVGYDDEQMAHDCDCGTAPEEAVNYIAGKYGLTPVSEVSLKPLFGIPS